MPGMPKRLRDYLTQRQIGKSPLCRHALPFRACPEARQLIARLLLVRLGEQFPEIGEAVRLRHAAKLVHHRGHREIQ